MDGILGWMNRGFFPSWYPPWEFWFSGILSPYFSNFNGILSFPKVKMVPNRSKFYVKKIVPKVGPTLGSFSKKLFEFCSESQIDGRAIK